MSSDADQRETMVRAAGPLVVPKRNRADEAEAALRKMIAGGRFTGVLPGVRFLAEALGVGVPTVSEALQRLRRDGWVESRGERSRFVVSREVVERNVHIPGRSDAGTRHLVILTPKDLSASPHEPFWKLVSRMAELLTPEGWTLRVHSVDYGHDKRNRAPWDALLSLDRPQALIVTRGTPWLADWARECGVPTFFFSGSFGGHPIPLVGYDGMKLMRDSLLELIRQGHRSMAVPMLGRSQSFVRRFRESAEQVCREQGVKLHLQTPLGSAFAVEAMRACLEKLWARRAPTALILVSWYEYLGAYGWLVSRGLRVPRDVSLVSLVGDATASWMVPEPARFEHDEAKLADVLAGWVLRPPVVDGGEAPLVLLEGRWVEGGSIGPAPGTSTGGSHHESVRKGEAGRPARL